MLTIIAYQTFDDASGYTFAEMARNDDEGWKPISGSMYMNGMFMFQAIVVIVNIKILIHSSIHSWLSLFFQFGSILVFYLAYGILAMPALDQIITGTFNMLLTLFTNWMVLFFLTLSYTLLEYISKVMYDNLHNIYKYQQMIEEEHKR